MNLCCVNLCQNDVVYTYHQNRTGSKSLIDHIFVDSRIADKVVKYEAVEDYVNFSDHLPVACHINLDFNVAKISLDNSGTKHVPKRSYGSIYCFSGCS